MLIFAGPKREAILLITITLEQTWIGYLASSVEAQGFSVAYFDCYSEPWKKAKEKFERCLRGVQPAIVGFSCLSFNRNSVRDAARMVKRIFPHVACAISTRGCPYRCHFCVSTLLILNSYFTLRQSMLDKNQIPLCFALATSGKYNCIMATRFVCLSLAKWCWISLTNASNYGRFHSLFKV